MKNIENFSEKNNIVFSRMVKGIKSAFYDLSVFLHNRLRLGRKKNSVTAYNRSKNLFIFCALVYPVSIFLVFYVYVNINSLLLSVKKYDYATGLYIYSGFGNFVKFINDLRNSYVLQVATVNSFILYGVKLLAMPFNIMCSYFIYKKIKFSEFFKVIIFLPNIISNVVMVIMYKYFVDKALPTIFNAFGIFNVPNLFMNSDTVFPTIIFFNLWMGLGGGLIIFTGVMSRIPDSLIEYGELEGITLWKEFWHVTVPLIFPTITIFLVTGVASIFTNTGSIFTFFGAAAPQNIYNYGYFLFIKIIQGASISEYPYASAAGILFTLVAAPVTLLVRWLLEKYGPSTEY